MKVSILDYDAGNLASVYNCFYNLGASVKVINNYKDIKKAERLVVPGVGSAKYSIDYLNKNKMFNELKLFIETGRPILGICLGLQIFGKNLCEHGKSEGLGFIDADVKEISVKNKSIMSHIGWNKIDSNKELTKRLNIKENTYFYFCHSYSLNIYKKSKLIYLKTFYQKEIPALVLKENFLGAQFHPEKSQIAGSKLIENFLHNL
jgi:imidazole glycerol-phosphate synthase subunit HisH